MRVRNLIGGFLLLILTACSGESYRDTNVEMKSVQELDIERYLGEWHEIARFPVSFQEGCTNVRAVYGKAEDEKVSVTNYCNKDGETTSIEGDATIEGPGKLGVSFFWFLPRGDYWVLWIDETYETVAVGVPSGNAGWILTRDPDRTRESLTGPLNALEQKWL